MTWHEAAPLTEERLPAAPTQTRSRQAAARSLTRLATLVAIPPERVGVGVCWKQTCEFSGNQFTRCFIEFVVVETKQIVRKFLSKILTQQTCGQHSGMAAACERQALAFYFSVRICDKFLIWNCRNESELGLCMISVHDFCSRSVHDFCAWFLFIYMNICIYIYMGDEWQAEASGKQKQMTLLHLCDTVHGLALLG